MCAVNAVWNLSLGLTVSALSLIAYRCTCHLTYHATGLPAHMPLSNHATCLIAYRPPLRWRNPWAQVCLSSRDRVLGSFSPLHQTTPELDSSDFHRALIPQRSCYHALDHQHFQLQSPPSSTKNEHHQPEHGRSCHHPCLGRALDRTSQAVPHQLENLEGSRGQWHPDCFFSRGPPELETPIRNPCLARAPQSRWPPTLSRQHCAGVNLEEHCCAARQHLPWPLCGGKRHRHRFFSKCAPELEAPIRNPCLARPPQSRRPTHTRQHWAGVNLEEHRCAARQHLPWPLCEGGG